MCGAASPRDRLGPSQTEEVLVVDSNTLTTNKSRRPGPEADPGASARTARRWVLITAPAFAGLLAIAGAAHNSSVGRRTVGVAGRDMTCRSSTKLRRTVSGQPSPRVSRKPMIRLSWTRSRGTGMPRRSRLSEARRCLHRRGWALTRGRRSKSVDGGQTDDDAEGRSGRASSGIFSSESSVPCCVRQ